MANLTLAFLGSYDVAVNGISVDSFESDKVRALLAYLTVEARPQHRERLAGLLWPDMPEASARHNLSQVLFNLRQTLHDREANPPFLLISRDTIQFNSDSSHTLDVTTFNALLDTCAAHAHAAIERCDLCARRLHNVAKLYRGAFLHQFFLNDSAPFDEWALLQREQLHRRALAALFHLAAYYEAQGDLAAALRVCEQQLTLDPWREEAHLQTIRLLALDGQRSAALAHYESCRRILAAELGVEPSVETKAVVEQIRTGDFPGQTRPVISFPVDQAEPSVHHAQPMPDVLPIFNLPTRLTPFVGRTSELAELSQLLADPLCRLLTLVGPGGMGKTRLAVQIAHELQARFAHGVIFVPLAAVVPSTGELNTGPTTTRASGTLIVPAIADALRFSFDGPADLQRQLLNHLGKKNLMLVLDNFEHLLADGQSLAVVQAILQHVPLVKILVTAREQLNIEGEWTFEVEGLGDSAAELFVQSARRARAGFVLSHEDTKWVEPICQLVGEMPLGIELAASWVRVLPVDEIAGEIARNLDFLTTSARDVPERHRSMRAVFNHSWHLLSDEERQGLQRLAIFRNGFRRQAAEEIAGISLSLLSALVAKSLLHRTSTTGRYDLHELVRQYAAEQLLRDAEDAEQTRTRHSAYFGTWLQEQDATIRGTIQPEGAAAIRAEIDNILLAWQWATTHRQVTQTRQMIYTLFWYYDITNRFREGMETFEQSVECFRSFQDAAGDIGVDERATLGHLLAFAGWFNMRFGRLIKARDAFTQGLTLLRPLQEPEALSDVLRGQGFLFYLTGDYHKARFSLEEGIAIKEVNGDDWEPSFQFVHRGILAFVQENYDEACHLLRQALAIVRRLGYSHAIARALIRLSTSVLATGISDECAYEEARTLAEESLQLSQLNRDTATIAHAYYLLGLIALHHGDVAESPALFHKSLELYQQIGDTWSSARVLNCLGEALLQLDDPTAVHIFTEAALTAMKVEVLPQVLEALAGLAAIALRHEAHEQALFLVLAVEEHLQAGPRMQTRIGTMRQIIEAQLTREQVATIRARIANQPIALLVEGAIGVQGERRG